VLCNALRCPRLKIEKTEVSQPIQTATPNRSRGAMIIGFAQGATSAPSDPWRWVLLEIRSVRGGLQDTDILKAIFEHLAVGVIVCDSDGRSLFFSPEAERVLGCEAMHADCTLACYQSDMVTPCPPEDFPLARAMRGETALHELIFVKNTLWPSGLWIDASGAPLHDGLGTLCGGILVFSDISLPENLLRHEAAVRAFSTSGQIASTPVKDGRLYPSEHFAQFRTMYTQLAKAVEETADAVLLTDSRGIIEYVNPAFEKMTGYSVTDVLGRIANELELGQRDNGFYRDLWGTLVSKDLFRGTTVNRKKSGELFWSALTITPIKDEIGMVTHFVCVMKDMTLFEKKKEQDCDLAMARELQQRYYNMTASLPGFDIAAAAFPAGQTGGDYFDFIQQRDNSLYVVVADIAGHGFGSAFVMAEVRASLRAYAALDPDIPSVLKYINRSLGNSMGGNRFVTMFLGRIDPLKRSMEYASAGHGLGYVLRGSGDIKTVLASTAVPLGLSPSIIPDEAFDPVLVTQLESGDTVVLLTDGVTEATNLDGDEFGVDRALEFIRRHPKSTSAELVQGLYLAVRDFAGGTPLIDDILSVICKVE
jgi:PAS domain S-box-containing protein